MSNEWIGREAFEALAQRSLERHSYVYDPSLNGFTISTISTETARPHMMTTPERAGKQEQMSQNNKAYQVELSTGAVVTVEANEVQETENRVKFLGHVPGHTDNSFNSEVVRSFRSEIVDSYRLVPVPERNEEAVGKNVYRVNLLDGTHKVVRGDVVAHANSGEGGTGRYVISTKQGNANGRTEYAVPEDRVADIERVTEGQDVPTQATEADVNA